MRPRDQKTLEKKTEEERLILTQGFRERESSDYPSSQIMLVGVALSLGARACSHTVVTD